jgi:hypothetical protein
LPCSLSQGKKSFYRFSADKLAPFKKTFVPRRLALQISLFCAKNKPMKNKKIVIAVLILLVALVVGGLFLAHRFGFIGRRDPFTVIPETASFIIETRTPVESFQAIHEHPVWVHARKQPYFAEITKTGADMSNFIADNKILFDQFGEKQSLISVHNVKPDEFDFLYVFNTDMLGDLAEFAQNAITPVLNRFGKAAAKKELGGKEVFQITSGGEGEILYLCFIDNLMLLSYSKTLIEQAVKQSQKPYFSHNDNFTHVKGKVSTRGLGNVYVHYKYFDRFAETFLAEPNDMVNHLTKSMFFTAAELDLSDENKVTFTGYSNFNDSVRTYLRALAESGSGTINSPRIIPQQAASFVNFNFDSFEEFYENLEVVFQDNESDYLEYETNLRMLEKLLKVDFRERLTAWIADEMTLIQLRTANSKELKDNFVLAVQAKDITEAKVNLDFIVNQTRKRTPFRFTEQKYRGYTINFLNIKGFFKLFLGKFFDKIEKPYFTYIEDYVLFSNNPETLRTIIDDYEIGLTLSNSTAFTDFYNDFSKTSNIFIWINTPFALQAGQFMTEPETWKKMVANQRFIICYPQFGIQLKEDGKNRYATRLSAQYRAPEEVAKEFNAFYTMRQEKLVSAGSSGVLNKLKNALSGSGGGGTFNLDDFLVLDSEVFNFENERKEITFNKTVKRQSGDTLFEYYVRENVLDGLYKEYISGTLRVKGKYRDDLKEGVWRYYDEKGRVIKKEHYTKGEKELFR